MGSHHEVGINSISLANEIDQQMFLTDCSLKILEAKNRAHVEGLLEGLEGQSASMALRNGVNTSLINQLEFFNQCTQLWAGVDIGQRKPFSNLHSPLVGATAAV